MLNDEVGGMAGSARPKVAIIGAGPAGIGISAMLAELGIKNQVIFEANKVKFFSFSILFISEIIFAFLSLKHSMTFPFFKNFK